VQRFADLRWAGFSAQRLMRRTELSATTKLSVEHETPPIANVLLAAGVLSAVLNSSINIFCQVLNSPVAL
jgi:hypothetical protein